MLSDLVSAYAAAGNRLPPSRPDLDIHFVPLPVRGLMAVLRLWETWLGEHTFTDEALVEVNVQGSVWVEGSTARASLESDWCAKLRRLISPRVWPNRGNLQQYSRDQNIANLTRNLFLRGWSDVH